MRRVAIMAAIILLGAETAPAARLCRDTKGLFTPCIGERPLAEHHHRGSEAAAASADQPTPRSEKAETRADRDAPAPRRTGRSSAPSKPPLVARTKLCRDSKGLFTPCVR